MSDSDNVVSLFDFNGQQVRTVILDGEPWFVAADVFRIIGTNLANVTAALKPLGSDEKRLLRRDDVPRNFLGSNCYQANAISESGFYKLVTRAQTKRPEVVKVQEWVTRDVLPAIRKTGGYLLNEDMRATAAADVLTEFPVPQSFAQALRLAADEHERAEAQKRETERLAA